MIRLRFNRQAVRRIALEGIILFACVSVLSVWGPGQAEALSLGGLVVYPMGLVRTMLAVFVLTAILLDPTTAGALIRHNGFFAAFCAYAGISILWSGADATPDGLRTLVNLTVGFGAYFVASVLGKNTGEASRLTKFILWTGAAIAIVSMLTGGYQAEMPEVGAAGDLDRVSRLAGILTSPNVLAAQLVLSMSVGLALLVGSGVSQRWRLRGGLTLLACAYPLALTLSRSGWIGMALAMACALALTGRWLLAVSAVVTGLIALQTDLGHRFLGAWELALSANISDMAAIPGYQNLYGRVEILWRPAVAALLTPMAFVFGAGGGTATFWASIVGLGGMHSEILQTLIDFGLVGVVLLVGGFAVAFARSYRTFRFGNTPFVRALALGGMCAELAILPKLLWDNLLNGANGYLLLAIVGLANGLPTRGTDPTSETADASRVNNRTESAPKPGEGGPDGPPGND